MADQSMTWQEQAACRNHKHRDWWFPPAPLAGRPYDPGYRADAAKRICEACPSKAPCLEFALDVGASCYGVWGGTDERERKRLLRRRGRGRAS